MMSQISEGNLQSLFQIFRFFFSDNMSIPTIFNEAAQLVLPIDFQVSQGFLVPQCHLVDDLHGEILIATSGRTTVVLTQAPSAFLDLLLVVTVAGFKRCLGFTHILPSAFVASSRVNDITTLTI